MFYKSLFTVPLQGQTITNNFKPFQTGSVFTRALLASTLLWDECGKKDLGHTFCPIGPKKI